MEKYDNLWLCMYWILFLGQLIYYLTGARYKWPYTESNSPNRPKIAATDGTAKDSCSRRPNPFEVIQGNVIIIGRFWYRPDDSVQFWVWKINGHWTMDIDFCKYMWVIK